MPKILLIILSYNGIKYFPDLFASFVKVTYPKEFWEIFVIDNASEDGSSQYLKDKVLPLSGATLPKIHFYQSQKNTGFVGNNIGMKFAIDNNFDYVFLLNQDALVEPNFLEKVVQAAENDKTTGAVQSLIKLWPEKALINTVGNRIHFLGFGYSFGYKWAEEQAYSHLNPPPSQGGGRRGIEIAYPSGAAVLLRTKALKDVGLFDEKFFLYHEDLDLGWRMHLGDWRVILAAESKIYHKYEFGRSIKKYYFMERNRLLFLLKNFQIFTLILIAPAFLVMEAGLLPYSLKSGFWRDKLRAYAYFLNPANWLYILRARHLVQQKRKLHDHEMYKWLTGKIEFQDIENDLLKNVVNPVFNFYWWLVKSLVLWWTRFLQSQKKEPEY